MVQRLLGLGRAPARDAGRRAGVLDCHAPAVARTARGPAIEVVPHVQRTGRPRAGRLERVCAALRAKGGFVIGPARRDSDRKAPATLLVDAGGVGYEVDVPMSTFYGLPVIGERITLLTHLVVREDAHQLFGFATQAERGAFRGADQDLGGGGPDRRWRFFQA